MSRPLRIFVDGHPFDKEYQGTQSFLRELYRGVHEADPSVELFVGARDPARVQEALPFLSPEQILPYRRQRLHWMRYFVDIPRWLRQHRFDFAHFQYLAPAPSGQCRYIVTTHDLLFRDQPAFFPLRYRWMRDPLFRLSINQAAVRTTVSSYSRQRIAHHYRLPDEALHVLPCALPAGFGQTDRRSEALRLMRNRYGIRNYLLCVSRIEPRKNQELLLRSFMELELYKCGYQLVFVGKPSIQHPAFERLLQQLCDEQKASVHWFPQVPQADLEDLYQGARALVYPSHGEGFGIPPLEAALCRVPVLCSSATALSDFEFFEPFRFAPTDRIQFQRQLLRILEQPPSEAALEAIRQTILHRYDARAVAEQFLHLLQPGKHE